MAKAVRVGDCLICHYKANTDGYVKVAGNEQAHRLVYRVLVGPIPEGICVLHTCDVRPCIEQTHLFLGTKYDNAMDMMAKGRNSTEGRPRLLTPAQELEAIALRGTGLSFDKIGKLYKVNGHTIRNVCLRGTNANPS